MRRRSFVTAVAALIACTLFLWMFFAASTLEHTADLGWISTPPGHSARAAAYEFAARWRHGMSGNSPLYMPGFFAAAIAVWFWCANRSWALVLAEGAIIIALASVGATLFAPFAAPGILADFRAQGFVVLDTASSGTWIAFAQGVYSLLTWGTLIITSRWSIKLRSPKPLLIPLVLNLVLALVRPWTVADFTSQWTREIVEGKPTAVVSFLMIPIVIGFIAWVELRVLRKKPTLEIL